MVTILTMAVLSLIAISFRQPFDGLTKLKYKEEGVVSGVLQILTIYVYVI